MVLHLNVKFKFQKSNKLISANRGIVVQNCISCVFRKIRQMGSMTYHLDTHGGEDILRCGLDIGSGEHKGHTLDFKKYFKTIFQI